MRFQAHICKNVKHGVLMFYFSFVCLYQRTASALAYDAVGDRIWDFGASGIRQYLHSHYAIYLCPDVLTFKDCSL